MYSCSANDTIVSAIVKVIARLAYLENRTAGMGTEWLAFSELRYF